MAYNHARHHSTTSILVLLSLILLVVSTANGFNVLRNLHPLSSREVHRRSTPAEFVIILDAGSSGTKVKAYEFPHVDSPDCRRLPTEVTTQLLRDSIKQKHALHKLAGQSTDKLRSYFTDIFQRLKAAALKDLPAQNTTLYLLGTAGMRTARKNNGHQIETLLNNVKDVLSNGTVHPYIFNPQNVNILSGKKEGTYAWLAANFLNGFFQSNMDRSESVGLLEMGGSSLQLAFMPTMTSAEGCNVKVTTNQNRSLHVKSYAGFGGSGINDKVLNTLCGTGADTVDNPCMLKGDNDTTTCNDQQRVTVIGTSDPDACSDILENIVDSAETNSSGTAAESLQFYAIGALRHPLETLQAVDNETQALNVDALRHNATEYCQMTLEEAAEFKGSDKFVSADCRDGLFIAEFLEGLGLDNNRFTVSEEINGKDISWALGAALDFVTTDIEINC